MQGEDELQVLVDRARDAYMAISSWTQDEVDQAVRAVAWSIFEPKNALRLAEVAVETTGLGNVVDKVTKNRRKTFGTLRDLLRTPTVGRIAYDPGSGLTTFGKAVGVVGAITPSTNPAATPANNAMMAIKGANSIIIAPSPAGWETAVAFAELAHEQLEMIGAPRDLIQVMPRPISIAATELLMESVDLVVATGAQHNVRSAYRSGTPAIGVGAGNVPVIVDSSADLQQAAEKIAASKTFDNSTSCSAENSLIVLDDVYEPMLAELVKVGAYRTSVEEASRIRSDVFIDGQVNRAVVGQDYSVLSERFGIAHDPSKRFFLVEADQPDPSDPMTGEKLSLVSGVYRASTLNAAIDQAATVLSVQGKGHSAGIHTKDRDHALRVAAALPVVRVLVNQAHAFGNGGSFDNAMPFSLSMGCGTWQGNSISENLNVSHFINRTFLVETFASAEPSEDDLFGPLLSFRSASTRQD